MIEPKCRLAIIVAMTSDRVIGKNGALPWHIPEDLKHFKQTTSGHAIIMGRKTHESIGRPLPQRRNIVLSRSPANRFNGCQTAASFNEALRIACKDDDCPFVIGGASIYAQALVQVTDLYITCIDRKVQGDTFFPDFDTTEFEEAERCVGSTPEITFRVLRRKSEHTLPSP